MFTGQTQARPRAHFIKHKQPLLPSPPPIKMKTNVKSITITVALWVKRRSPPQSTSSSQVTQVAVKRRTHRDDTCCISSSPGEEVAEEVVCVPRGLGEGGSCLWLASQSNAKAHAAPAVRYICIQEIHSYRYRYNCELQLCRRHINSWQHVQRQTISGDVWQMFSDESSHLNRTEREEGRETESVCE